MTIDMLIANGTVVTHSGRFRGNLLIRDGKVEAVTSSGYQPGALRTIDASGKYILPGAIDSHVHFMDPGLTSREDFPHGTAAAAAGGVTTAISHPMNKPPIVDEESYNFTVNAYRGRGYIDYGVHGGGTSDNVELVADLWKNTGATTVKMFTCFSVADFPYVRDDALYDILSRLAAVDGIAMIHAENNELIDLEERRLKAQGRNDPMAYHQSHSDVGELESVKRVLHFLEATGATAVILHSGMEAALREIDDAKRRGVKVFAECCPHYFTFADTDMMEYGPYLKFSPVMRDEANRQVLWRMLRDGYIDTMGSDHSPYTDSEKRAGMEDIWKAPNGIPGIQTMVPVLLDGVSQGHIPLEKVVEVTSYNPARIYGLDYRKGQLLPGMDADLMIVDMSLEKEFTREEILSKAKWSPYVGKRLKGWPVTTLVRGEIVYADGRVVGREGHGIYIERRK